MTQQGFKRKPAAILSADVVGYSRLMSEDEVATIRTLSAYRDINPTQNGYGVGLLLLPDEVESVVTANS